MSWDAKDFFKKTKLAPYSTASKVDKEISDMLFDEREYLKEKILKEDNCLDNKVDEYNDLTKKADITSVVHNLSSIVGFGTAGAVAFTSLLYGTVPEFPSIPMNIALGGVVASFLTKRALNVIEGRLDNKYLSIERLSERIENDAERYKLVEEVINSHNKTLIAEKEMMEYFNEPKNLKTDIVEIINKKYNGAVGKNNIVDLEKYKKEWGIENEECQIIDFNQYKKEQGFDTENYQEEGLFDKVVNLIKNKLQINRAKVLEGEETLNSENATQEAQILNGQEFTSEHIIEVNKMELKNVDNSLKVDVQIYEDNTQENFENDQTIMMQSKEEQIKMPEIKETSDIQNLE